MTEKVEELILEQLFNLSNKIDNMHTEMNERFEAQDRKIEELEKRFDEKLAKQKDELIDKMEEQAKMFDEKLAKQKDELIYKMEEQTKIFDEKLSKQKDELIDRIDEQGNKIYEKIAEVEMSTAQLITDVTQYDAEKRKELEDKIEDKIENKIVDIRKMRK